MQNLDSHPAEKTDEAPDIQEYGTPAGSSKLSLGVGTLLGESFSVIFRHIVLVVLLGFVPVLLGQIVTGLLAGYEIQVGSADYQSSGLDNGLATFLAALISIAAYTITIALLVQLAYDAKLRRRIRVRHYFTNAVRTVVPIAVLNIVIVAILATAGFAIVYPGGVAGISPLMTLPVLFALLAWIYSLFSVTAPAVVIENAGFRGLGRSLALTKDYRWPIVGCLFLAMIFAVIIFFVGGLIVALLAAVGGIPGTILALIGLSVLYAVGTGLFSILTALIYARLREIKEGIGIEEIAAVFD
ncbi:hypothetical protein ABLO27_24995 [Roseibium sp. SCPC15]|uniref:hypothetical protein n=1 Tax=Roseibium sp. SCP15 TaxID=3141376 RepID=UPI003337A5B9